MYVKCLQVIMCVYPVYVKRVIVNVVYIFDVDMYAVS